MRLRLSVLLPILVMCSGFADAQALSWLMKRSEGNQGNIQEHNSKSDVWGSGELSAILDNHDRLESYKRKPDCFARVAKSIRIQCGDLDLNEDERVRAAISMTICELATAKHTPPLECMSVNAEQPAEATPTLQHGACVEALSRSAQYWSSYSGYLREIPQLCHAFRRWNDIDMAKEVYRNATMQAISILRVVNDTGNRQDSFYEGIDAIREHLRHLVHELNMVNDSMGKSTLDVRREIQHANEQAITVVKNALSSVFEHHSEAYRLLLNEVSQEVRAVVGDHTIALELLVPSLQAALEAQVSTTFAQVRTQYQDLNDIALTAQANWRAAGHEVGLMKETVSALVQTISESAVVLDSHVDQAVLANRMQVETTEAVSRLGTVLTGLVSSTRTEMEKINDTAVAVRDQWLAASSMQVHFFDWQRWSNWSQCGLLWLLQILFKVDSVVLERVFGSPLLQLTSVICRVVWYIICSSLTSVTSILLLVTSWKHWVLPRETVVDTEESAGISYPAEPEKRRIRPQPRVVTCSPSSQAGSRSHVAYARFSRIPDRLCRTSTD